MSRMLHVGNLPDSVTDRELRQKFDRFGRVTSAQIMKDDVTGESRGFGMVEMAESASAVAAIRWLNCSAFDGQVMAVTLAKPN